ncbi:MAG TPA: response regulator transcription factor [Gaiellaceae bacterium]|jgi:DNA-binding response OmpR family regulator|nr:response regulator transcription factor [Gaiellaceae bacterium]
MTAALLLTAAEPDTRGFLERHLRNDGFELVDRAPDLVLAGDVEQVDEWRDRAAVIVLGRPNADAVDRLHAFRRGCDDYVAPPFDYQELVERIRAVLRRVRPGEGSVLEAATLTLDTVTREVRVDGTRAVLSQKEHELLARLVREPQRVFTKAELLRDVWGYQRPGRTRTLDSHASRLRRKLRDLDPATPWVDNVWGVGYRLLGDIPEA